MDDEHQRATGSESIGDRTAKGLMWAVSGSGVQSLLRLVSVVVLARLLTPEDFGVWGAAGTVIALALAFSEAGLGRAVVRQPSLTDREISSATWTSALLGVVLAGIVYLASGAITSFFRIDELGSVLPAVVLLFPLEGLAAVPRAVLERELRFKELALIETISYGSGYILFAVAAGLAGWGVWALVGGALTHRVITASAALTLARSHLSPRLSVGDLRGLAGTGGGFALGKLMNYFALQGDFIVAGRMLGAASLGLYNRAYKLIAFPVNLFALAVEQVLFPSVSEVQRQREKVRLALRRGAVLMALGFLPVSLVGLVLADEIVAVALGPQWGGAVLPFRILAVGAFFRAGYKVGDAVSGALGAVYRRALRHGVYAALVIGGSIVGATLGGLPGLATGVLVALVAQFVMMAQLSLRLSGLGWREYVLAYVAPLRWTSIVGVGLAGAAIGLRAADLPDIVVLLGSLATAGVAAVVLVRTFPESLGEDGQWLLARAISVVRRD